MTMKSIILAGALIEITEPFLGPIPNIIPFQFNPSSMTRRVKPWTPSKAERDQGERLIDPMAQPYHPNESIRFKLSLVTHDTYRPDKLVLGIGVADRLAAIEKLLYPTGEGGVIADVFATLGGAVAPARPNRLPIVLFFYGPGRIVPVRVTAMSITEQEFTPLLYPKRAEVELTLKLLHRDEIKGDGTAEKMARSCWDWTQGQKDILAIYNLTNVVESAIGMLPI